MSAESQATAAAVRRTQWRLTLLAMAAAALGLTAMAVLTTSIDDRLRGDRLDENLLGRASRAAALIFFKGDQVRLNGLRDDAVLSDGPLVVFVAGPGTALQPVNEADPPPGAAELASSARSDVEEAGSFAEIEDGSGEDLRAAALPIFRGDQVAGAVVVATDPAEEERDHDRLALAVWLAALGLLVAAGGASWWLARRSVHPLEASLEHERRFLSSAAHELRIPVARIRAVAENARRLARRRDRGAGLDHELDRIVELSEQAGETVDGLLTVARIDADRVPLADEPIKLESLLSELEQRSSDVIADVEAPAEVRGDERMLERALEEVIGNARKHGARPDRPAAIEARLRREGSMAVISVVDDGPGFSPEQTDEAFERFTSGPRSHGSGLGLWIVRWIVERHAGSVVAISRPQGGLVEIRLPVSGSGR